MSTSILSVTVPTSIGFFILGIVGVHYDIMAQGAGQWMVFFGTILLLIDLILLLGNTPDRIAFSLVFSLVVFIVCSFYFTPEPIGGVLDNFKEDVSNYFNGLWNGFVEWISKWWWVLLSITLIAVLRKQIYYAIVFIAFWIRELFKRALGNKNDNEVS